MSLAYGFIIIVSLLEFGFPANGVVCQETCYNVNVEQRRDKYGNLEWNKL